jgi:DNA-binding MarR family transcriptional regulator
VLHLVWLNQPVTLTDLEMLSGGRPTTVRDVVNDLVERGYVAREPNPADRRSHLLVTTAEGDRVSRLAMQATEGVRARLKPHLAWSIDELDPRFEELIEALRAALRSD